MPHHEDDDFAPEVRNRRSNLEDGMKESLSPEANARLRHQEFGKDATVIAVAATGSNARQVGGSHYGGTPLQHWDMVEMFDLDYFQGQITKYVMRWKKKNGIQDLAKAEHFLEKYIELARARGAGKATTQEGR